MCEWSSWQYVVVYQYTIMSSDMTVTPVVLGIQNLFSDNEC